MRDVFHALIHTILLWAMQSQGDLRASLDKALEDFWAVAGAKKD